MSKDSPVFYEFDKFRLIPEERQLLREGEPVPLTPKAFDLLLAMVEQPGRLLAKEALLERVWANTFVEENNLADNISRLRKSLGESQNGEKFIETVPRRGYRFVAAVTSANGGSLASDRDRPVEPQVLPGRRSPRRRLGWVALVVLAPVLAGFLIWLQMRFSTHAEARNLEFKGSFYYGQWTEPEIRKGIALYERAIAMEPDSSNLQNGLCVGWLFLSDLYAAPRETMPKAKAANARALERDPANGWAHASRGLIAAQYDWDWVTAESEFKQAIRLDPEFASGHILYGWYLMAVGRFADAIREIRPVVEADPLNEFGLWSHGLALYFAGRYDEAIEQYRRAIGVDRKSHWAHLLLGWSLERQGKFEEALDVLKIAYGINDNPQIKASIGHVYAAYGRKDDARGIIAELSETARHQYVSPYDVATIFAAIGDQEKALEWLERAFEHRSGWMGLWLKVDPKFEGLRKDTRFQDLLRRVGHGS